MNPSGRDSHAFIHSLHLFTVLIVGNIVGILEYTIHHILHRFPYFFLHRYHRTSFYRGLRYPDLSSLSYTITATTNISIMRYNIQCEPPSTLISSFLANYLDTLTLKLRVPSTMDIVLLRTDQ